MIVVDSSALIAIVFGEPERAAFEPAIKNAAHQELGRAAFVQGR
jgi:uncharacterized protein with PIN domain